MIKLSGVCKNFSTHQALINVHLEIFPHQIVALIGPSGSGKSTLLRCINLLDTPSSGVVQVGPVVFNAEGGDQKDKVKKIRQKIGMVFQHFHLFPHMTVLENLIYAPIHVLKKDPEIAKQKALLLLDRVKMRDKAFDYPAQLSGGQKQRTAIARALAVEPEVMLFDEPTSSLDPEMVKEVLDVMKELALQRMTMVVVTHEMRFAQAAASRILFMDKGSIVEDASPADFFTAPSSKRAREFLSKLL